MAGLLAALLAVYIGMQIYLVSYPSYRTEIAVLCELADEISAEGTVVRTETVSQDSVGVKYFLVSDGDKVAKGESVAEYYRDSSSAVRSLYVEELKKELALLEDVSKGNRGNTNLSSIRRSVYNILYEYSAEAEQGDYSSAGGVKRSLLSFLSSYDVSAGGEVDTSARVSVLKEQIAALDTSSAEPIGYVTAEESGFFVSFTDGCESVMTPEALETMSPEEIRDAVEKCRSSYSYDPDDYKILSDYSWYYVCTVSAEDASRLRAGRSYTVDFKYSEARDVPAKVDRILVSEDGTFAAVVLRFERMNNAVALLRNEDVMIKFSNYRGIKVDKTALRLKDGELGVFIKYGSLVQFRKVDIIYEDEDYVLSSVTEGSSSYLSLYDEVIIQGKNLYENRDLSRS